MKNAIFQIKEPQSQPELGYLPGSPERASLKAELARQYATTVEIPCIIGGKEIFTGCTVDLIMPDEKHHILGHAHLAGEAELELAKRSALEAHEQWEAMSYEHRLAVFLRAAELLARNPWHDVIAAATILNQAKNIVQTEGDAGSGLIDLIRYDVFNCAEIYKDQPNCLPTAINRVEWRPLEGFVAAITPFNYVSDACNLAIAPAVAGNTVVWKPSTTSILSNYYVMRALMEAGLPAGVINFLPSRGADFSRCVLTDPALAGIHFIGSTETFRGFWTLVGENIARYKNFPRIVGETGGKNFLLAYRDCNEDVLLTALVKGAFELQGQKCSATSRAYLPASVWARIRPRLLEACARIKTGPATDFDSYVCGIIDQASFDKLKRYIDAARSDPDAEVLCGGYDDCVGFFVQPTVILCKKPDYVTMVKELFGPVLSVYVYDDTANIDQIIRLVNETTDYALTGSVVCADREMLAYLEEKLRYAAGNLYLNDKSTGSMAGYVPFGGARASGTDDKPGSRINMMRWMSPRTIKDNIDPPTAWDYPCMAEK